MSTTMPSSLEIAQAATLRPIGDVADELGLLHEEVEPYGRYKAKVDLRSSSGSPTGPTRSSSTSRRSRRRRPARGRRRRPSRSRRASASSAAARCCVSARRRSGRSSA